MKYVDTNGFKGIFFLKIYQMKLCLFLCLWVSYPLGKMVVAFLDVNVLSTDVYMHTNSTGSSARRKSGNLLENIW